ncbi:MAG: aminopeptidase [marine bacterium B5-7]|nr:MAG: aminopeptidase [marine bacterium B5-7]
MNYYAQSIQGQFEIIQKRQNINTLLGNNELSDSQRKRLEVVMKLREFSISQLGLPDNNSYLSYADLERDFVIWNIFATEEFSLSPLKWCYLIVGCLNYRGYFSEADAKNHVIKLKEQGHDTFIGGVSAYSTLGWFDDPVLNTMLRWNDIQLATVMFHELAHQQLYIKNDTEFNESYAEAVATIGVVKWLEQSSDNNLLSEYIQFQSQEKKFISLVMKYKAALDKLYRSETDKKQMLIQKKAVFQQMEDEYKTLSHHWKKDRYTHWFSTDLNNAKLAAIVTYQQYASSFINIFNKLDKDLNRFYSLIKSLSHCKQMKRKEILDAQEIKFEC